MSNKLKFSVIIPVYGVEKYLSTAIESVLSQTYQNFEIILVDDASPDACPAICEEYAKKFDNIKCVHHEINQGLSAARNTGLKYVTGEYVTFIDSDDYVDSDIFQSVKDSLDENPADCVVYGIREEYFNKEGKLCKTYELNYGSEERVSSQDEVRRLAIKLEEKTFLGYSTNKFYKTKCILDRNITFEKVTLIEDIVFNINFFKEIRSLNVLNVSPYHYMHRIDGSLTNKFVKDYYLLHRRRVEMMLELYKGWNMCDETVKSSLANIYARYIYSALQRNCDKRSGMDRQARKKFLEAIFNDEMFKELSPFIDEDGYAGVLYSSLRKRKLGICIFWGRIIYIIKEKMPIIFSIAKQRK